MEKTENVLTMYCTWITLNSMQDSLVQAVMVISGDIGVEYGEQTCAMLEIRRI